jgi:hypothetical protein
MAKAMLRRRATAQPRGARMQLSPAGGPSANRRRVTAVGVALSLCPFLIAGCASASSGTGGSPSPQVQAETISWFFPATVEQSDNVWEFYDALRSLEQQALNGCISRFGFGVQADSYVTAYENYLSNRFRALPGYRQQWSLNLINVHAVAQTGMLVEVMTGTNSPPSASGLPVSEMRAINADFVRCIRQVRQPTRKFQRDGSALKQLWDISSGNVYRSSAIDQADLSFQSCMMQQGAPQTAAASSAQFQIWLTGVVNPAGWTNGSLASRPRAALDAHWTAVWARCAGPVVSVWQRLLLAAQKSFLEVHYQQVTALERLVGQSVLQLQKMGAQL